MADGRVSCTSCSNSPNCVFDDGSIDACYRIIEELGLSKSSQHLTVTVLSLYDEHCHNAYFLRYLKSHLAGAASVFTMYVYNLLKATQTRERRRLAAVVLRLTRIGADGSVITSCSRR